MQTMVKQRYPTDANYKTSRDISLMQTMVKQRYPTDASHRSSGDIPMLQTMGQAGMSHQCKQRVKQNSPTDASWGSSTELFDQRTGVSSDTTKMCQLLELKPSKDWETDSKLILAPLSRMAGKTVVVCVDGCRYYRYVRVCACYYRGCLAHFSLDVLFLSGRFFLFFSFFYVW